MKKVVIHRQSKAQVRMVLQRTGKLVLLNYSGLVAKKISVFRPKQKYVCLKTRPEQDTGVWLFQLLKMLNIWDAEVMVA